MSLSASARWSSSVSVEDESTAAATSSSSSAALKDCSCCFRSLPEGKFSSAQLKKKGKRACSSCVSKRDAAAEAAAAQQSFATRLAQVSSTAPLATCPSCNKKRVRVATCSACKSSCCSLACFQQHQAGFQCEAIRTMPPLSIADEDLLTEAEVAELWSRLHQRAYSTPQRMALLASEIEFAREREARFGGAAARAKDLAFVLRIYPPRPSFPWWLERSELAREFAALRMGKCVLLSAIGFVNVMGTPRISSRKSGRIKNMQPLQHINGSWMPNPVSGATLPDEGRLIQRLMRYWIYYMRHVDPQLIPAELRPYVNVSSDEFGE